MKTILQTAFVVVVLFALAAVSSVARQTGQTGSPSNADYILGPEDQILIRALDAGEISDKPVPIGAGGDISLPMVGRLRASGLTVQQLETEITSRLKSYIREPQVSVSVVELRSQPVSV